jgi:hypothetical protein
MKAVFAEFKPNKVYAIDDEMEHGKEILKINSKEYEKI